MGRVADQLDLNVLSLIPAEITFTDKTLRAELDKVGAGENIDLLDEVREFVGDGWEYTDADLREHLLELGDEEAVELLDDIRALLADGWTYTHNDLRGHIVDIAQVDDETNTLRDFDRGRDIFSLARTWRYLVYLPVFLVLVLIGLLGGRTWSSRLAWAASFLVIAAAVLFVLFGPVYDFAAESNIIDDLREDALEEIAVTDDFPNTQLLVTNKSIDILESVVGGFASGVATKSLILFVVGLGVLALLLARPEMGRLRRLFGR